MIHALIGHLVGDFLLQNDWQSGSKKSNSFVCAVHVLIWTLTVLTFTGWWDWRIALWLAGTHFAIDRTQFVSNWMALTRQVKFRDGICAPWGAIVVDQILHLLTLYVVAVLLKQTGG